MHSCLCVNLFFTSNKTIYKVKMNPTWQMSFPKHGVIVAIFAALHVPTQTLAEHPVHAYGEKAMLSNMLIIERNNSNLIIIRK